MLASPVPYPSSLIPHPSHVMGWAEQIENFAAYVDALRTGIPPCKLPKFMFRAGACYGYFEGG